MKVGLGGRAGREGRVGRPIPWAAGVGRECGRQYSFMWLGLGQSSVRELAMGGVCS